MAVAPMFSADNFFYKISEATWRSF